MRKSLLTVTSSEANFGDMWQYHVNSIFVSRDINNVPVQCITSNVNLQFSSTDELTTTVCKPCPVGTYMVEYAHHNTKCVEDNLVCPAGMIKIPSEVDKAPR